MNTKSLIYLPGTLTSENQIITLDHPNYEENKAQITLILSNGSDNNQQKVYWLQRNRFGKSPEGNDLTVKSTFYFKSDELQKGGIINNDCVHFTTDYDLSFSLISYFYKLNKINFVLNKEFESKFETLNDIHMVLFEKCNSNWRYINQELLKNCLIKICHHIEEDHGEETKELFFKITEDNFLEFFVSKIKKIADAFPPKVWNKINNSYPALSLQESKICVQAKFFYSLQLMASLIPFEIYEYLNKTFKTSLYSDFIKYVEVDYKKTIEKNKQEELLLNSVKSLNQGLQSNTVKEKVISNKKLKTKPVPRSKGLDSFFKAKK